VPANTVEAAERVSRSLKPHAALVAVQLFFGTWPIVGKIALRTLPSTGLVALRVIGATIAFVALRLIATGNMRLARRSDYARLALYSLLGVVLNQFLYVKGLALSTVINATLLSTTIPIATLLVSMLLGRERPAPRVILGMTVAACGVVFLVNPARADFSHGTMIGNLLLVLNTLAYGAYIAISQDVIRRYGALTVITWVFIFGCVATLPVGGYYLAQTPLTAINAHVWLAVLYIILVPTVGAYYLNAWALGRVTPSTVAIYIYLQPLIAFALAPLVLGERLNARTGSAALLIFAGVALVTLGARSRTVEEVSERPEALGH
jgi:drug/metabolite transporter (DMT)-like permease